MKTSFERNVHIYIYKYYERKKGRNYISWQACFVNRFTLQGFNGFINRLVGKCSYILFSSHNIYSALLQRIEHCSTRKSTCRLPIYIYIFLSLTYIHLICIHMLPIVLYLPLTPLTLLSLQFRPLLYYVTSILKFLFCI